MTASQAAPAKLCGTCQRWTRHGPRTGKCGLYDFVVTAPNEPREFGTTNELDFCKYHIPFPDLFSHAEPACVKETPEGWARKPGTYGKGTCGATHTHVSGHRVIHCGHPTALWPYYIVTPAGETVLAPNGRGFKYLADAKAAAERLAPN